MLVGKATDPDYLPDQWLFNVVYSNHLYLTIYQIRRNN
ncbi:hypothetical protein N624_0194 [Levilactobacillus brevis]|nr:hypothetical protein N624_0194 [Levilactobacillus brevis]